MRKISIIGNFDIKNNSYNGQTIKTRIVADELESLYGASEIKRIDTAGGKGVVLRLLFQLFGCVMGSRNIIILPAERHKGDSAACRDIQSSLLTPYPLCSDRRMARRTAAAQPLAAAFRQAPAHDIPRNAEHEDGACRIGLASR